MKRDDENPDLRQYFIRRLSALDGVRSDEIATWRELARHFAPRRGRRLAGHDGRRRAPAEHLPDNTPQLAVRTLASGMMAGLSSPARPWFRLRVPDEAVAQEPSVRAWLDDAQTRLLHIFAHSNLYNCLHAVYGELAVFGTAALWVDEDDEDIVRAYTLSAGEYWLASSRRLAVDTVYRTVTWSVRQIVDMFGRDTVSEAVRHAFVRGELDRVFEIIHAVEPNPNAAVHLGPATAWHGRVNTRMPWRSVWFEREAGAERGLLRVSGYEEFPCMAPRWETTGSDSWGWGPAWTALGDARQLQAQQKAKLGAIQKLVNPPMIGPPSLRNQKINLGPGMVTYVAEMAGQSLRPALDLRIDLSHLVADIAQVQQRIRSACFADLFLMVAESDRRQVTAREIDERHLEKMLMLGPVLERLHDELLEPLVKRVYRIARRNHIIPPPPELLQRSPAQIEFISLLASAQKAAATGVVERLWRFGGELGALRPEALDRLDPDGSMEAYADMLGAPASVLVDRRRADATRQARAAAAASRQVLEDGLALVEGVKTASGIDLGGGVNAVEAVLDGDRAVGRNQTPPVSRAPEVFSSPRHRGEVSAKRTEGS